MIFTPRLTPPSQTDLHWIKTTHGGYNKCIDALEFHHENPSKKEFKLGSGNTMSWKEYKAEALKCILVCSNCHKEIHSELGYKDIDIISGKISLELGNKKDK